MRARTTETSRLFLFTSKQAVHTVYGLSVCVCVWCRPQDTSSEGFKDWAFMTTHCWDEDPRGEWTMEIQDASGLSNYGNYQAPSRWTERDGSECTMHSESFQTLSSFPHFFYISDLK